MNEAEKYRRKPAVDFALGIAMPVLCVVFDPIVFRFTDAVIGPALCPRIILLSYWMIAVGVIALSIELVFKPKSWLLAGTLLAGAAFSTGLGIRILPYSLLGMLYMLLGVLGLTPFATAWTLFKAAFRAIGPSAQVPSQRGRLVKACAVASITLAVPLAVQLWVNVRSDDAIGIILGRRSGNTELAIAELRRLSPIVSVDGLLYEYADRGATNRQQIAEAYEKITGESIMPKAMMLND